MITVDVADVDLVQTEGGKASFRPCSDDDDVILELVQPNVLHAMSMDVIQVDSRPPVAVSLVIHSFEGGLVFPGIDSDDDALSGLPQRNCLRHERPAAEHAELDDELG